MKDAIIIVIAIIIGLIARKIYEHWRDRNDA